MSSALLNVNDYDHLKKDKTSNAIINTNKREYEEFLKFRKKKLQDKKRLETLETRLDNVETSLNEILTILKRGLN